MRFLRILWVVCQLSVSCLSVVCQLSVGCLSVLSRALVLCFAGCLSAGCPFLAALWRSQFGPHFARPVERVCNLPKGKERKSEAFCGGGRQSGLPFITNAWQEYRQGSTTPPSCLLSCRFPLALPTSKFCFHLVREAFQTQL